MNLKTIKRMSDLGAKEVLDEICTAIKEEDADMAKAFLEKLIPMLDELEQDDFLGTEGWRHRFGFED